MVMPKGAKELYLNKKNNEILGRFTADELATLVEKGKKLFELTMTEPTEEEWQYLVDNPDLMEVIQKW